MICVYEWRDVSQPSMELMVERRCVHDCMVVMR